MSSRAQGRLQGDDLIGEVLRNMDEGVFRIRRKTLVPAIYRIYLHPDDYEPFRDVVPFIAGEIRAALDEKLSTLNRSPRKVAASLLGKIGAGTLKKIGRGTEPEPSAGYVRMSDGWTVEIYPDLDEKLEPGEIEVHSELGSPQKTEYGAGSMTRRIIPQRAESVPQAAESIEKTSSDSAPAVATAPAQPASEAEEAKPDQTKGLVFAYLRYADQEGQRTFEVTRNQVVIGRGGRSYWVDLKLETLPDVSREHCRIRRDPETGRFSVEDVSQFGTAVNGKPVGRNEAAELPKRATISLAGVIDLQWEAV
jgi:predicted component of type VI protein secretion system